MADFRNPFKLRSAEQINDPAQFLRLFDPHVLNILSVDWFIDKVHFINSSPGAGKSTLLRIFSPDVLLSLHHLKNNPDYEDIYSKLESLNVISNTGPHLLGIEISCSGNFKSLMDSGFTSAEEERLLFTLLTSRLTLSMLHCVMVLNELSSPDELSELRIIQNPYTSKFISSGQIPDNGKDLFRWADNIEKIACEIIDSLDTKKEFHLKDISNILSLLKAEYWLFRDEPIADKTLIMFDDFHELPYTHRKIIKDFLINREFPMCFWIAQRYEGIDPHDFFYTEVKAGPDIGRKFYVVNLEEQWRNRLRGGITAYENILSNIADKRVSISKYKTLNLFRDCLKESIDDKRSENKFEKICKDLSTKISEKVKSSKKYSSWINEIEMINENKESAYDRAVAWRSLEILIARAEKKGQLTLEFEFLEESPIDRDVMVLKSSAQLFLAKEYDIPYYFGFPLLAKLSSSNIEQFLAFSADLFEEVISLHTLKKNTFSLLPHRQEQIIKNVADSKWIEIPKRIPHGNEIQYFLTQFCQFASTETYNPSASYPPGITGFTISDEELKLLVNSLKSNKNLGYSNLAYLLYICLSNNLLQMTPNISQGGGRIGHQFYLNRWICVKFNLPLGYGGWRWKRIDELTKWASPTKALIGDNKQIYDDYYERNNT